MPNGRRSRRTPKGCEVTRLMEQGNLIKAYQIAVRRGGQTPHGNVIERLADRLLEADPAGNLRMVRRMMERPEFRNRLSERQRQRIDATIASFSPRARSGGAKT